MSKAWMPFYGGDFIGNTMHLSRGAIGSYVLLLWHHWEHGSLPADENALRRIARCQGGAPWTALWRQLKPFFHTRQDNPDRIYSTRALAELSRNAEISNKRKGAALQMHSKCRASAEHLHTQSQSQSPSKTVIVSTQSKGTPSRSGSNGPRAGAATIGERMGDYVWNGRIWAEYHEPDEPFG